MSNNDMNEEELERLNKEIEDELNTYDADTAFQKKRNNF